MGDSTRAEQSTDTHEYLDTLYGALLRRGIGTSAPTGDFSLCFFDVHRGSVVLYRSLTSHASLYYKVRGRRVDWSTNPLDLLGNVALISAVDVEVLPLLVVGDSYSPEQSCFRGLRRVPAGWKLEIQPGNVSLTQVCDFEVATRKWSVAAAVEQTRVRLAERADAEFSTAGEHIGLSLSGGLDSSTVAYLAAQRGQRLTAFHAYYEHHDNEVAYAEEVASACGVELVTVELPDPIRTGTLVDATTPPPLPGASPFNASRDAIAQAAADRGIRVLIHGGSSEYAFGLGPYLELSGIHRRLPPRDLVRFLRGAAGLSVSSADLATNWSRSAQERWEVRTENRRIKAAVSYLTDPAALRASAGARFDSAHGTVTVRAAMNSLRQELESEEWTGVDLAYFRPHGIAWSDFFLDASLIGFGLSLGPELRAYPVAGILVTRPVLRLAMIGRLPASVIRRLNGPWMSVALHEYVYRHRDKMSATFDRSLLAELGIVDPLQVRSILGRLHDHPGVVAPLLTTLSVEAWLRRLAGGERHAAV